MKILFVSSGNAKEGISPIIKNQGQSLIKQGFEVDFFTINGKGLLSYIQHIFILRDHIKGKNYDIIHAHYSFCSYVASFSGARPLVVSLMGSDVIARQYPRIVMVFFYKLFWCQTIVKSLEMYQNLGLKKIEIIPNGVDTGIFETLDKINCQDKLGWDKEKTHILFASDPARPEKNFILFQRAIDLIVNDYEIVLHFLKDIPQNDIPGYINASDVLVLTSLHEGSPNTIKEAMACNCPIVCTNVGDVKWIIGKTDGCYITSFEPENIAEKIKTAIAFGHRTNGRDRIIELGLDSKTVAGKIIEVYKRVLSIDD